jgi:hypothetical protein
MFTVALRTLLAKDRLTVLGEPGLTVSGAGIDCVTQSPGPVVLIAT